MSEDPVFTGAHGTGEILIKIYRHPRSQFKESSEALKINSNGIKKDEFMNNS